MAYNFTKSDGTAVSIPDNQVVSNQFSVDILGRNVSGYGLYVARAFIRMLENFSAPTAPQHPTSGQTWYDTSVGVLKVYDGAAWRPLLTSASGGTSFTLSQDIVPNATCTAGEGIDIGTTALRFCNVWADTFHGTATQASYADLAERYETDTIYLPGTIVKLGGEKEITAASGIDTVFGVISTNPAFLMNSTAGDDVTHPPVGLVGRVPVLVTGVVNKFDYIIASDIPGIAKARTALDGLDKPIIGRALAAHEAEDIGLVEVTLGAK